MTQFIESRLGKGEKIPTFRLSYLKVMWRDIQILIHQLLNVTFLPNDIERDKFLVDFKTASSDGLSFSD